MHIVGLFCDTIVSSSSRRVRSRSSVGGSNGTKGTHVGSTCGNENSVTPVQGVVTSNSSSSKPFESSAAAATIKTGGKNKTRAGTVQGEVQNRRGLKDIDESTCHTNDSIRNSSAKHVNASTERNHTKTAHAPASTTTESTQTENTHTHEHTTNTLTTTEAVAKHALPTSDHLMSGGGEAEEIPRGSATGDRGRRASARGRGARGGARERGGGAGGAEAVGEVREEVGLYV